MNLTAPSKRLSGGPGRRRVGERGSAVLLVLALLSVMLLLVSSDARVLSHLKQEIRLLDQRQQRRFESPQRGAPASTNAVPATPTEQPRQTDHGQG